MKKVNVGIMGCGAIAPAYLRNLKSHFAGTVEVVACADTFAENAAKIAREFGIPRHGTPEELLRLPEVELVINLTPAPAHHEVSLGILRAGKHLFTEKPLSLSLAHGKELVHLAASRGLHIGGAADTFLGAGGQLARKLVDEGRIGTPIAAQAVWGSDVFHSERYHKIFRGSLLDLGPYYLTALVNILGPVTRVASAAEIRFKEKPHPINSPEAGKTFPVDFPTTVSGSLDFADGTVASIISSCDLHGYFPRVEIFGRTGSITLSDANKYFARVTVRNIDGEQSFDAAPGFRELGRGLGVAEMAQALRENRAPRANGDLMLHILEVMLAVHDSSPANQHVRINSRVERPATFDYAQLPPGTVK
ncbi:MAG TPA: Gfo/Idh/MocA family oxidoreductase [Opitutaceae bacterium]|nr:Gfo/Idh/MocA family oxidoreductase [Opitutaceae bacterium]